MNKVDTKLVTCNGCFDGLHPGHLFFLGFCRGLGSELIVGINHDDYILQAKKRNPYYSQEERSKALLSLGFVNRVVVFEEDTPNEMLRKLKPSIHCTGEEYGENCPESEVCKELGTKLVLIPRINFWSISNLDEVNKEFVDSYMNRLLV